MYGFPYIVFVCYCFGDVALDLCPNCGCYVLPVIVVAEYQNVSFLRRACYRERRPVLVFVSCKAVHVDRVVRYLLT